MADKYCDHGAYGATNRLGLDVPVWGIPQDGDGTVKTPSLTSGTAFISFSAAPTSGTISVCGVMVSTTSVLNAASADAAANALATNINATTTAVASGVSAAVPQLRNLVYARGPSGGAPAGTCQIMMRVGSPSLDYANNATCLVATTFNNVSSSATNHQFTGGVGGCWGFLVNTVSIGVGSSIVPGHYGVYSARPIAGAVANGDKVFLRSKLIQANTNVAINSSIIPTLGSADAPVYFIPDDGTVWTSDVEPILEFRHAGDGSFGFFNSPVGSRVVWLGSKYSNGTRNLLFNHASNDIYNNSYSLLLLPGSRLINAELKKTGGNTGSINLTTAGSNFDILTPISVEGCRFGRGTYVLTNEYGPSVYYRLTGCVFDATGSVSPTNGIIGLQSEPYSTVFEFIGCKFIGFVSGSTIFPTTTSANRRFAAHLVDCSLGGMTSFGAQHYNNVQSFNPGSAATKTHSITETSGSRRFYFENQQYILSWNVGDNQPVLNATLPDGITKMSLTVRLSTLGALLGRSSPAPLPRIAKVNTLGANRLQVTVPFLYDESFTLPWGSDDFEVLLTYVDNTGSYVTETLMDGGLSVVNDPQSWYPENVNGKPFFGAMLFNKRKISFVTSSPVADQTEVSVSILVKRRFDNTSQLLVFDMDPALAVYQ